MISPWLIILYMLLCDSVMSYIYFPQHQSSGCRNIYRIGTFNAVSELQMTQMKQTGKEIPIDFENLKYNELRRIAVEVGVGGLCAHVWVGYYAFGR